MAGEADAAPWACVSFMPVTGQRTPTKETDNARAIKAGPPFTHLWPPRLSLGVGGLPLRSPLLELIDSTAGASEAGGWEHKLGSARPSRNLRVGRRSDIYRRRRRACHSSERRGGEVQSRACV